MEIKIRVDHVKPLEGTISNRPTSEGSTFSGWLELLRLLDELLSPEDAVDIDSPPRDDL